MTTPSLQDLSKMIDLALLHPTTTDSDIVKGCAIARHYDVATVCIKPYAIPLVKDLLADSSVGICPVIAFPHGNSTTSIKVKEAEEAAIAGGQEIDMVINIAKALENDWSYLFNEINAVNQAVTAHQAILKVIFENDYLDDSQIIRLCEICSELQVAFVKTSTGFGFVKQTNGLYDYIGATGHHLKLMRKHSAPSVQIKASGGIRNLDDLLRVRALGATRAGASAAQAILEEAKLRFTSTQS